MVVSGGAGRGRSSVEEGRSGPSGIGVGGEVDGCSWIWASDDYDLFGSGRIKSVVLRIDSGGGSHSGDGRGSSDGGGVMWKQPKKGALAQGGHAIYLGKLPRLLTGEEEDEKEPRPPDRRPELHEVHHGGEETQALLSKN
uniref:Uncharacterized protein n=1 Tax=Arundo donax TaxID=35708 RepID=A0A0A9A5X5_ARUDO